MFGEERKSETDRCWFAGGGAGLGGIAAKRFGFISLSGAIDPAGRVLVDTLQHINQVGVGIDVV